MAPNHSTNWQYPFDRKPHVKSGEKLAQAVLEKKTFKNSAILYRHKTQGQGQKTLGEKINYN